MKTAYKVATLGTVSAASDALGVHRATVIRHIDSLEGKLGQKLFIRHTSGYTPTESCKEITRVVKVTDDQFTSLSNKLHGQKERLSGELVISSPEFVSPLIMPALSKFQNENPGIKTKYLMSNEILKLEYGETHLALMPGPIPAEPDNIVIPFYNYTVGLYASPSYSEKHGLPANTDAFKNHYFIERGHEEICSPFEKWLRDHVPEEQFVFRSLSPLVLHMAVINGIGIGFIPPYKARQYPELIEVLPKMEEWSVPISLVTHKDMHNTEKVQKLIQILKAQ
ncbi:MAG: LysR family transcriptional regulator [Pseudomonadota bacterium]